MFLRRAVIAAGGSAVALFAAVSVGRSEDDSDPLSAGWDSNWDSRASLAKQPGVLRYTEDKYEYHRKEDYKNKSNRHIFLIQHANYKTYTSSDKLTAEGYEQADLTGKRLATLAKGPGMAEKRQAIQFKHIIYSPQTTTKETAERISRHLPGVTMFSSDSLNEGPPIQTSQDPDWKPDLNHLETPFRKYIYRPDPEQSEDTYEIMVCHADLIRYIVCKL
ncbi:serine/threonine-protein phosphatase PGAM5, mitochondrial-like isoform X2 [Pelobates fuscus]|uniref:serine/threonine-protein phosphatase PGAM5, mitochondrial-like isoform X2 n=1 Tax=Pelobates fuscus TaxID=191477 RepID=UPI002FE42D7B